MKTPKEIKVGLECGVGKKETCYGCTYKGTPKCMERVSEDALEYIGILEEAKAERDAAAEELQKVKAELEVVIAKLETTTRERDAAVKDLKENEICCQCVHWPSLNLQTAKCEVSEKARSMFGAIRCKNDCWEWRGIKEDAEKDELAEKKT